MTEDDSELRRWNEREARSLALEKAYVHDVYSQIAPHFAQSRSKVWPQVKQFLLDLEPGSLICDAGCGNGKYLDVNPDIFKIGSDRCHQLAEIASTRHHELVVCDNMHLPFRDESYDAALSIAVIHHFATTERRVQALRELTRVLRLGGRIMISVWAMEQRHRRFESQDVLVPWHRPIESSSEAEPSQADNELTSTTTTTSDDDILNYHAHSKFDSQSSLTPSKKRHKARAARKQCRNSVFYPMCPSSSQSSSDLSSPNETCYSFVRRALAKFSSSRHWDDPRQSCRPYWFNQPEQSSSSIHSTVEQQDSLESNENVDDLPIELHDVDTQIAETNDFAMKQEHLFDSTMTPQLNRKSKSKSLSDIFSIFPVAFFRQRKSSHDSTLGSNAKSKIFSTSFDSGKSQKIIKSKSTHLQLTKVEENDDPESTTQVPHVRTRLLESRKTPSTESRRPRSLIIPGERMLNADDHRNGNTILPDWDLLESIEGSFTENSFTCTNSSRDSSKRSSWPVIQAKAPLFTKRDVHNSLLNSREHLKNISDSLNGDSLPDSGVEDLHEKSNSCTWNKGPTKNSSLLDSKSYLLPARLRNLFSKHCKNMKNSNVEEVMKTTLYQNLINHIIEQDHLFPCHSMPELNVAELEELSLETVLKLQHQLQEELNCEKEWNKENVALQLRNGYKQRSISADVTSVVSRRKYINLLNHSLSIGCVKRSISMENPASECFLDFAEQERVYCNRITKEDSLQHDTSFDSDDSVASVIAVTQNKVNLIENCKGSRPGTPDGARASDTSIDSEDSCISVIAVSLRDLPEFAEEVSEIVSLTKESSPVVSCLQNGLECSAANIESPEDHCKITQDYDEDEVSLPPYLDDTNEKSYTVNHCKITQDYDEDEVSLPPYLDDINEKSYTVNYCDDGDHDGSSETRLTPESITQFINKGSSYQDLVYESNSWQEQPEFDVLDCSELNATCQQGDRKLLRKAGSLPEQSEPNKLKIENNLSNHSSLSVSTDLCLASRLGLDLRMELDRSGSLSSSRSSSTSSVCWEKFLDASHSVKLDNIAIVTAGNNLIQNSQKSKAILKNASQHSCILQNAAKGKTKKLVCAKSSIVANEEPTLMNLYDDSLDSDSMNVDILQDEFIAQTNCKYSLDGIDDQVDSLHCELDYDYASTTNVTDDAYLTDQTNTTRHSFSPPETQSSLDTDEGLSNKQMDMLDDSDQLLVGETTADNEFKEAGVQTSFILYSSSEKDKSEEEQITEERSAEQEDELNGNIPSNKLQSSNSCYTTLLSSDKLVKNDTSVSKVDFVNNATQFVKILNVQSIQPLDESLSSMNKTKPVLLEKLHSQMQVDVNGFHDILGIPGHSYVEHNNVSSDAEQLDESACRTPITAIPKNISFFPSDCVLKSGGLKSGETNSGHERQELQSKVDGDVMVTSTSSSIEKHFGNLEFLPDEEQCSSNVPLRCKSEEDSRTTTTSHHLNQDSKCLKSKDRSLSLSTSDDSLQCESDTGGSVTFHRYYHVFREGELDQLIEKYIENLHIISSFYDHSNWCIIAEKVQVWRI